MRDAFISTLLEEAKKNPNIVLITGDLGYGVLDKFQRELPNQFINSGINEQAMMGMAAGIASTGKRVFVYSIGNFPTLRCLEQIRNDVCLMNNSVVIVSVGAGYAYGPQGYTHHALEDIAVLRALPNIDVVVPADPFETVSITQLLASTTHPSYLRLGKSNENNLQATKPNLNYGKINEIIDGDAGSLLFIGSVGEIALEASVELRSRGILVSVASVPFLTNLDREYLKEAAVKGPILTIEEHSMRGGLGSAILEFFNSIQTHVRIAVIASDQNNLSQIGSQKFLQEANQISSHSIVKRFIACLED